VTNERRELLARLAAFSAGLALPGCGGGGADPLPAPLGGTSPSPSPAPAATPPPPVPSPSPGLAATPLDRLRAALARPALVMPTAAIEVSQTSGPNRGSPSQGAGALIVPTPRGAGVNPNPDTLADIDAVWGHHRAGWTRQRAGLVGTTAADTGWYVPVSRDHRGSTLGSNGVCALHFRTDGSAFELLFAGTDVQATLVVDGRYAVAETITTQWRSGGRGAALNQPNAWTRFDFGGRALRDVSVYARSSQGPCALAFAAGDRVSAWDRSAEASMAAIADSYGGAPSERWGISGPFWEAAALLGIPHVDLDAIGGTGYAPQNTNADTRDAGNRFAARLASTVDAQPDLLIVAGGINDNHSQAAPPLFATAAEARGRFETEVREFYAAARAALPQSLIVALSPWAPREQVPPSAVELSKAEIVQQALQAAGGPWIFIDNLRGG
jgi:hypothetical protein